MYCVDEQAEGAPRRLIRYKGLFAAAGIANRQNFAAFCAPAGEEFAAIFCSHTGTESVFIGSFAPAGLVRAFHGCLCKSIRPGKIVAQLNALRAFEFRVQSAECRIGFFGRPASNSALGARHSARQALDYQAPHPYHTFPCGNSSVGRASASQAEGRGFESRFPLQANAEFGVPSAELVFLETFAHPA